jgi:pyridoxal phosphate enzyme (YggS family)
MAVNVAGYHELISTLSRDNVTLVAVSKTKPVSAIQELYDLGQRDFGENYVQELVDKHTQLPADIRWHFIGHLQSNKVKYIAPFVSLIHGVDSVKLLLEINKQAVKYGRVIPVLLQLHIASEETKFGFDEKEFDDFLGRFLELPLSQVRVAGLMGMASFTSDHMQLKKEFGYLKDQFDRLVAHSQALPESKRNLLQPTLLSMGMSSDYPLAIAAGSNLVRIGSLLFGSR